MKKMFEWNDENNLMNSYFRIKYQNLQMLID